MRIMHVLASACIVSATTLAAHAGVAPKDTLDVQQKFVDVGAPSCATAMAKVIDFLKEGRADRVNYQWNKVDTDSRPITVDFVVAGDKNNYSRVGSALLEHVGNKCRGSYVYTQAVSAGYCSTAMAKDGFVAPQWSIESSDANGDGGKVYFASPASDASITVILNDVPGGCILTKRESVSFDAD